VNRAPIHWDSATLNQLIRELVEVRKELVQAESEAARLLRRVHPTQLKSARNLVHYLALRRVDLRPLQPRLTALGLSSLGRSEAHVMATLDAVLRILHALARKPWPWAWEPGPVGFEEGRALLKGRTLELLGPKASGRWVRIMATMPSEAAESPDLVRQLLEAGMNCMRVNCAHDHAAAWRKMVRHLRTAQRQTGLPCRVLFDLGGPKLRTGPLAPGPHVLKIRPKRDVLGKVTAPARIWLTAADRLEAPPESCDAVLPLPRAWLRKSRAGNVVRFEDARNASREITVISVHGHSRWAEGRQTAYVRTGTEFVLAAAAAPRRPRRSSCARIVDLPDREEPIVLHLNDTLMLTSKPEAGHGAVLNKQGKIKRPAHIGCTAPEVFNDVKPGERVWLDDGKIGAVIESVTKTQLKLRITQARAKGEKLRADKGINFPDSALRLPSLSADDLRNLPEVVRRTDLIGHSFVQRARDVEKLQRQLQRLRSAGLGVILKIETRTAFEHLPELLLAAMRSPCIGVMIARGDLAVECGYERLAEIQEEILWLCEAAHVPVIWATQVLEKLSRSGSPTRAEITDAAMGVRAECVMLNKGPGMVAAVRALDNILRRMQAHQNKKQSMLRSLGIARNFNPQQTKPRRLKARAFSPHLLSKRRAALPRSVPSLSREVMQRVVRARRHSRRLARAHF
jgi:pyruvate kinase